MRLPAFICGLAILTIALAVWGRLTEAGLSLTLLMMLAAAVLAQGFYLMLIMLLARDQVQIKQKTKPDDRAIHRNTPGVPAHAVEPKSQG